MIHVYVGARVGDDSDFFSFPVIHAIKWTTTQSTLKTKSGIDYIVNYLVSVNGFSVVDTEVNNSQ